jgi:PAS domain S-box-containing protein
LKIIDALKSSGSAKNIEVTVTIKSGKLVHGLFSADIIRLSEGDFILSALMDITERKRIEAELRSSEERFLKAFTLNPMSMAISTIEEGRFIDVNKTFLESLRYTREEVIGRTSAELGIFSPPEQRLKIINALRTAGSARNIEVVIAAKDGTLSYGLFSAEILKLGEGDFILSALMDITERKRVEAELRSSEEKYRLLHESMKDGFVSLDLDGYILECNESYCSMVGYTAEELSHMTYLDLTPEEWRAYRRTS